MFRFKTGHELVKCSFDVKPVHSLQRFPVGYAVALTKFDESVPAARMCHSLELVHAIAGLWVEVQWSA